MSERKLKGYAVKLIRKVTKRDYFQVDASTTGEVAWAQCTSAHLPPVTHKDSRLVVREYRTATEMMSAAIRRESLETRARIVAIYTKPKRTVAEERADVVAWLEDTYSLKAANEAARGAHVGAAKREVQPDTDAAQLEALGRANG